MKEALINQIVQVVANKLASNVSLIVRDLNGQLADNIADESNGATIKVSLLVDFTTFGDERIFVKPCVSWKKESKHKDEGDAVCIDPDQPDLFSILSEYQNRAASESQPVPNKPVPEPQPPTPPPAETEETEEPEEPEEPEIAKLEEFLDDFELGPSRTEITGDHGSLFHLICKDGSCKKLKIIDHAEMDDGGDEFLRTHTILHESSLTELLKLYINHTIPSEQHHVVVRKEYQDGSRRYYICHKRAVKNEDIKEAEPLDEQPRAICGHPHADGVRKCYRTLGHPGLHDYTSPTGG